MKSIIIVMFSFLPFFALADSDLNNPDTIAEGGRLYDKWWAEYDLKKPQTTHPSYPSVGKKSGSSTWRCKECHGWDYKGAAGAYAKGSHYTGIKGVTKTKNASVSKIVNILKNDTHRYSEVMNDYALIRIAIFLKYGQVDISSHIDKETKLVKGNTTRGKVIFDEACEDCHESDGRGRNFKTKNNPEYIGTVSLKNPWEAIHKIRNGHPGAFVMGDPMPHMNEQLNLKEQLDLLRYMQTLPIK